MKKILTAAVVFAACALTLSAQNTYSSSTQGVEIAAATPAVAPLTLSSSADADGSQAATASRHKLAPVTPPFRSFSRVALGAGVSMMGGVDFYAATNPLSWMNLRVTGRYLSYTYNSGITEGGINITPGINLQSVQVSADVLPFKHSNFHISPGILFGASNNIQGNVNAPVNTKLSFNDVDYTAQGTVTGKFKINMSPNTTAATVGVGFGNLLPRKGSHWSVPFDIAVAFTGAPKATFNLNGTVCTTTAPVTCNNINSFSQFTNNVTAEQNNINSDLNGLQAYPLVSIGLAYNFKIR